MDYVDKDIAHITTSVSKESTNINSEYEMPGVSEEQEVPKPVDNERVMDDTDGGGRGEIDVLYSVNEVPPWYLCLLLAFQQYLTAIGGLMGAPLLLSKFYCVEGDVEGITHLIGTVFVACGISTVLQTSIGVRLPIVQGCTAAFFGPIIAVLSQPEWKCPYLNHDDIANATASSLPPLGSDHHKEMWQSRIRLIQGSMMVASLFQVVIGSTGAIGVMLRYVGPLTICPTISLIGISLFGIASDFASKQWYIALSTSVIIAICSQYLRKLGFPFCVYKAKKGCSIVKFPIFQLFPVVFAILINWCICAILTETNSLPDNQHQWGYAARTDIKSAALYSSPWFKVPYPGQWGMPTVSAAAVCGMIVAIIASVIESIGDYRSCARISGAPPPPHHAINRGIAVEGIGCILNGAFGSGNGTTSYSENIGTILITRVGSRRVVCVTGIIMIILGCLGKFVAIFVAIPDPILGGMFMITFGMIISVGLSNLQYVDLNSSRNLFIIGASLFAGLTIPQWISGNQAVIHTGSDVLNQIIVILLTTNSFVGGVLGFFLDNTIPGTLEERGLKNWNTKEAEDEHKEVKHTYDLPFIQKYIDRLTTVTKWIPICPAFSSCRSCRKQQFDLKDDRVV